MSLRDRSLASRAFNVFDREIMPSRHIEHPSFEHIVTMGNVRSLTINELMRIGGRQSMQAAMILHEAFRPQTPETA